MCIVPRYVYVCIFICIYIEREWEKYIMRGYEAERAHPRPQSRPASMSGRVHSMSKVSDTEWIYCARKKGREKKGIKKKEKKNCIKTVPETSEGLREKKWEPRVESSPTENRDSNARPTNWFVYEKIFTKCTTGLGTGASRPAMKNKWEKNEIDVEKKGSWKVRPFAFCFDSHFCIFLFRAF